MVYMNTPQLETERLILRKFTENDIEALYLILADKEVNTFLPWFPLKTIEEAQAFIPPDWFGEDVTYSGNYHNSTLSRISG